MASGLINYLLVYKYDKIWMWFISCIPIVAGFFLFCKLANINEKSAFRWLIGLGFSLVGFLIDLIIIIYILEGIKYMYIWFFISIILNFILSWFYLNLICVIVKAIWKISKTNQKHAHGIAFGIEFAASAVAIFDFIWRIAQFILRK